jgi:hypothetical protein
VFCLEHPAFDFPHPPGDCFQFLMRSRLFELWFADISHREAFLRCVVVEADGLVEAVVDDPFVSASAD